MKESGKLVAELRQNYSQKKLDFDTADMNPMVLFETWFKEAMGAQLTEPNAMGLATATREGKPSLRTVLLKGFDANGFIFYSNYESRKGHELDENPQAALNFLWLELERQIRIEGLVARTSAEESDQYFETRPQGSKLGAWVSPQSQKLTMSEIQAREVEFVKFFEDKTIERPPHWGGYRLIPSLIEFWQGRPNRLHDRLVYERIGDTWQLSRLAP